MPKRKNLTKVHGAAVYFTYVSQDVEDIATTFRVSKRTVKRWAADDPEWKKSLRACGGSTDLKFQPKPTRKADRDAGDLFNEAKDVYTQAHVDGEPLHKLARITSDKVKNGLSPRRVHEWAKKHQWLEIKTQKEPIRIHGAAGYFTKVSRYLEDIIKTFGISEETISEWMRSPEWERALDIWGHQGTRKPVEKNPKNGKSVGDFFTQINNDASYHDHTYEDGFDRRERSPAVDRLIAAERLIVAAKLSKFENAGKQTGFKNAAKRRKSTN